MSIRLETYLRALVAQCLGGSYPAQMSSKIRRRVLLGTGAAVVAIGGAAAYWRLRPLPLREVADAGDRPVRDYRIRDGQADALELAIAADDGDAAALTRRAIEAMGGMGRFVAKGDVVAVKPNIGFDRVAAHAANTSPEVVGAVVEAVLAAGAKRVVVTDHSAEDAERCFRRSGIGPKASQLGAEVVLPTEEQFTEVAVGGRVIDSWPMLRPVLEADKVINVPVAKDHGSQRYSGALKNWFGLIADSRSQLHKHLDESIVDLVTFLRPTLTIIDATRVLMRNGPLGGHIADVSEKNTVVAAVDQVAADAFACSLLGLKPDDVSHLRLAAERGLGRSDWRALRYRRV